MLVIRLARTGRHKYPTYRLVAADKRKAANGKFISVLGHYNPHTKELVMDKEQIVKYMSTGAQPSNRVIKLLQQQNVELPVWAKLQTKSKPAKKVVEPKAETPAEADTEEVADAAPAEDSEAEVAPAESAAETATEQEASVEDNASSVDAVETASVEPTATEEANG